MLHALVALAAEEAEPSKTPFYLVGGLWAAYAVVLGVVGSTRPNFPGNAGTAKLIYATSTVLMIAAMAAAVISS